MSRESRTSHSAMHVENPPHQPALRQYDRHESYEWNYRHAPEPTGLAKPPDVPGDWHFCGLPVRSPLGMPAGPLLNSGWIRYYASLGFDVLTYKTVRSGWRNCHPLPNLLPVTSEPLLQEPAEVQAEEVGKPFDSWAISFGMPSRDPADWRDDVRLAREALGERQVLVVSVVASPHSDWSTDQIADDYAQCARWAVESGADAVEANLSCPNVASAEGDLFLQPATAGAIVGRMRSVMPDRPLVLKVGVFPNESLRAQFCDAVAPYVTAVSTTNTVRAQVASSRTKESAPFGRALRGIGGHAAERLCFQELVRWSELIGQRGYPLKLIAVGGIATVEHVTRRLEAGAHHVQIATAAMLDPLVGYRIRQKWPPLGPSSSVRTGPPPGDR